MSLAGPEGSERERDDAGHKGGWQGSTLAGIEAREARPVPLCWQHSSLPDIRDVKQSSCLLQPVDRLCRQLVAQRPKQELHAWICPRPDKESWAGQDRTASGWAHCRSLPRGDACRKPLALPVAVEMPRLPCTWAAAGSAAKCTVQCLCTGGDLVGHPLFSPISPLGGWAPCLLDMFKSRLGANSLVAVSANHSDMDHMYDAIKPTAPGAFRSTAAFSEVLAQPAAGCSGQPTVVHHKQLDGRL